MTEVEREKIAIIADNVSDLDPDLGVFWIRIQIFDRRSGFHEYGSETLNNIILNILQKLI